MSAFYRHLFEIIRLTVDQLTKPEVSGLNSPTVCKWCIPFKRRRDSEEHENTEGSNRLSSYYGLFFTVRLVIPLLLVI